MIFINDFAVLSALGNNKLSTIDSLNRQVSGLVYDNTFLQNHKSTWLGKVTAELPVICAAFKIHRSRNNQLLLAAFKQIEEKFSQLVTLTTKQRVAIILGSSTSGIAEGEAAIEYFQQQAAKPNGYSYQQQELGDPSIFLASYLATTGPAYTISTACSSSARAIISGCRLLEAGIVDLALVGGADSLCKMTLNGFDSLASISATKCTPFAQERSGINIGEAAGLMLLSKQPADIFIAGFGESSDAWHMSAPHPEGRGAAKAMQDALQRAKLTSSDIGYINYHGTGTQLNDQAESRAAFSLFGDRVPGSSTKQLTGHALGAAGILEAIISALIIRQNLALPKQDFTTSSRDNTLPAIQLVTEEQYLAKPYVLSNSLAFGGNNASLILGLNKE